MERVAVRADIVEGERDAVMRVAIEGASWQINVWAPPRDWERLSEVPKTDGQSREALRLGTVEGRAVWWQSSNGALYVNIGKQGPEAADFGLVLPVSVLEQIRDAVADVDEGWG